MNEFKYSIATERCVARLSGNTNATSMADYNAIMLLSAIKGTIIKHSVTTCVVRVDQYVIKIYMF